MESSITLRLKATPAVKFLTAVGDWENRTTWKPRSGVAMEQVAFGYKRFSNAFEDGGSTIVILRASDLAVVEVQTLVATPDRRGHGTTTMKRLCALADQLGVTLWLDAYPFREFSADISQTKVKSFYRGFGFIPVQCITSEWQCGFHTLRQRKFQNPMIRMPKVEVGCAEVA